MYSILVPLDDSKANNMAVETAIEIAKKHKAKLAGMGIVDIPSITGSEGVPLGATYFKKEKDDVLLENATETVRKFLGDFGEACRAEDVEYETVVARGTPFDEICRESHRHDVIVMNRETHFHFETQLAPDDVFRYIVRDTPRPVIAVGRQKPEGDQILVAYNGSLESARALQMYHAIGLSQGCPLHIVTVNQDKEKADYINDHAVSYCHNRGSKVTGLPIATSQKPEEVLLEYVDKLKARYVVIGDCGHSALRQMLWGSVSSSVIRQCPVPLFIYG